ncbi:MAG: NAD(P)-dependent alcohol dehydrogenase [Cyclobacteriaceae bacterium]|nr:NAD(P)-dependent alcohol dehydrogenase [Cyclobacteriaceae bacterium]
MYAFCYYHYGMPDQLQLEEVSKPIPKSGEVLVKVMAASLNSWDLDMLHGNSWIIRSISGLFKPRYTILGADIAGVVVEVGPNTHDFKIGDEVFGDIAEAKFGGFAEYVAVPERLLARKSSRMSFEQAAALPQAGLLALQGLRYQGEVKPGQHVLINGAGGGVGTLALPYLKSLGAHVTCVDRPEKLEFLKKLGADEVIDFTTTDYTRTGFTYDKILDVIAHRSTADYKRALKPTGVFAMIGGSMGGLLFRMIAIEPLLSRFRKKKLGIMGYRSTRTDLDLLTELVETDKVIPVIDRVFQLEHTADAFRHFIVGTFIGKIVISVVRGHTS